MSTMHASVESVLQQHNDMLQAHRRFLDTLKARSKGVANAEEVLNICAAHTESMVEDFEQCKSKIISLSTTGAPTPGNHDSPRPRNAQTQRVGVNGGKQTIDDSGLFMTDTSPTPIEDLLRASNRGGKAMPSRAKRKFDEDVYDAADVGDDDKPRSLKKAKVHGHGLSKGSKEKLQTVGRPQDAANPPKPNGKEHLRNGSGPQNVPSTERDGAGPQNAPEPEPEDDSFIREVEELLKIQAEKKRKKANKKRKRESGDSDVQPVQSLGFQEGDEAGTSKPTRKKAKTRNSVAISDGTGTDQSTPLRQSTPLSDRNNKRPSPASDYVDSILRRAKRKKT